MRYSTIVGILLLLLFVSSVLAQETRGTIRGTISDSEKRAIANASIKITDVARGTTAKSTSDSKGFFQAKYLTPSTYRVTVESNSFIRSINQNVVFQMDQ